MLPHVIGVRDETSSINIRTRCILHNFTPGAREFSSIVRLPPSLSQSPCFHINLIFLFFSYLFSKTPLCPPAPPRRRCSYSGCCETREPTDPNLYEPQYRHLRKPIPSPLHATSAVSPPSSASPARSDFEPSTHNLAQQVNQEPFSSPKTGPQTPHNNTANPSAGAKEAESGCQEDDFTDSSPDQFHDRSVKNFG